MTLDPGRTLKAYTERTSDLLLHFLCFLHICTLDKPAVIQIFSIENGEMKSVSSDIATAVDFAQVGWNR